MKQIISYVFPIFNEEQNIRILHAEIVKSIKCLEKRYQFELIFVNDGSRDSSYKELLALRKKDQRVKIINFSRNFGHQVAITAGIDCAIGQAVIVMDSDLQDPPAVAIELIREWQNGFDVVYAQRKTRKDTFFKKITAAVYYRLMQKMSNIDIPLNVGDFRLIDRKVVAVLSACREKNRYVRGLVSYAGFKQGAVLFDRDERLNGQSAYPFSKMLKLAIDGLTGFSHAPLKIANFIGTLTIGLAFLTLAYVLYMKLFQPEFTVPGWTLLMIVVLVMNSIQMILIGVIGQYIGRIYSEAQNRPLYIIQDKIGLDK